MKMKDCRMEELISLNNLTIKYSKIKLRWYNLKYNKRTNRSIF